MAEQNAGREVRRMYDKEVLADMNKRHTKLLKIQDDWIERMDVYLLEQQIPPDLISHVTTFFITRFHKSLLALRLLTVSGFGDEAYSVLRMMVEYTITLKFVSHNPAERIVPFAEDTTEIAAEDTFHHPDTTPDLLTMADETDMLDWYNSVYRPYSRCTYPHLNSDTGEIVLSAGPTVFQADDLLAKSHQLAAIIMDCARHTSGFNSRSL
jgi:hypothetical protein